jgi:uncharacterized membrane protein
MAANAGKSKDSKSKGRGRPRAAEGTAGGYAREALAQWATAARLGAAAVASRKVTPDGGIVRRAAGAATDWALARTGTMGKLASKLSVGSRALGARPGTGDDDEVELPGDAESVAAIPIQESVEIAVPVGLAYRLALRFEDYPQFLAHVDDVSVDGDEVEFQAKLRGTPRPVVVEVFDARENERIDWRGTHGIAHAGTASFHELAPRLTHVELSVDMEPRGPGQRLSRVLHLSDHAVRNELRRFKAFAELYEDEGDAEFEPEPEESEEEKPEAEAEEAEREPEDEDLTGDEEDEDVTEDEADEAEVQAAG